MAATTRRSAHGSAGKWLREASIRVLSMSRHPMRCPRRTTGVGFSPGDDFYNEPYFYVSLYPGPDVAALPPLPAIGHWHATPFTAAIARARRIVEAEDQKREVEAFLHAAVEIAIKALS